jgi:hypothetical protein
MKSDFGRFPVPNWTFFETERRPSSELPKTPFSVSAPISCSCLVLICHPMGTSIIRDISEIEAFPERWLSDGRFWRETPFVWTKWESHHEDHTHNHCNFCFACICDHRERFPEEESSHRERGCYRHAYYAEREKDVYLWVCRTCFKKIRGELGWTARKALARKD